MHFQITNSLLMMNINNSDNEQSTYAEIVQNTCWIQASTDTTSTGWQASSGSLDVCITLDRYVLFFLI
jgi:hypothetical protein